MGRKPGAAADRAPNQLSFSGGSASKARILASIVLAGCCALVAHTRVYSDFELTRFKLVTTATAAVDGSVVIALPDLQRLGGKAPAIVARVRNDGEEAISLAVRVGDIELSRTRVGAGVERRIDTSLGGFESGLDSSTLEFAAAAQSWSVEYLEVATMYGYSTGPLSFVVVPELARDYGAAPTSAALLLFVGLFALFVVSPRLTAPERYRRVHAALAGVTLTAFSAAALSSLVSQYKLLLSPAFFVIGVGFLLLPLMTYVVTLRSRDSDMGAAGGRWTRVVHLRYPRALSALSALAVLLFVAYAGMFYSVDTGFTSLIEMGDQFHRRALPSVQAAPIHVVRRSSGYDGQFYAQLAVDPLLRDPQIDAALDRPAYRARRILFSWTAYVLGLGQPTWVLHAYALQNILCWLLFAWILRRWLPPENLGNLLLWAGCLFSYGMVISTRLSLLEGPSLLLQALAMLALDRRWPWIATAVLGLAGLGRETNLLWAASLPPGGADKPTRWRATNRLAQGLILALPLLLWVAYLSYSGYAVGDGGSRNLGLPFVAYLGKWAETVSALRSAGWRAPEATSLLCLVGITVQATSLAVRPDWKCPWWRAGFAYVVLAAFLGAAVWEGDPGAATRILLPLTLAFNVTLRRDRWFWPVAVLGNLTAVAGLGVIIPVLRWAS